MSRKPGGKYINFFEARRGDEQPPAEDRSTARVEQTVPEPVQVVAPAGELRRRGRPAGGKSTNPQYTQISAYVPKEVYATTQIGLQKEAIKTGKKRDFSDLLEELLRAWNERNS